jgi:DNA-binding IclR family transcriptional regulator
MSNSNTVVDAATMRARNSNMLLNLIWREQNISRADLARRTGMSPSTVSAIVGDLMSSRLVRDIGAGASTVSASRARAASAPAQCQAEHQPR